MKQQKWNSTTRKFYVGLVVILLCFVGSIWLVVQEQGTTSDDMDEMLRKYTGRQYRKVWEKLVDATIDYYSGNLHDWAKYTIEFEEGTEQYEVQYVPGHLLLVERSSPNVIGNYDGMDYVSVFVDYAFGMECIYYLTISDECDEMRVYYLNEIEELPKDADIVHDANDTMQVVKDKLGLIEAYHKNTKKPYLYLSLIAITILGLWFFLMPPIESLQKSEKMKKKRMLVTGILIVSFGVWFGIPGSIIAALIAYRLEKGLPEKDIAFCSKMVVPSLVINFCVGYFLVWLIPDQTFAGVPVIGFLFLMLSVIGMILGYGAFGITYDIKGRQKDRKERR